MSGAYFAADDLVFRPVTDADIARLARWLRDPEVGAWWYGLGVTYDEAFVHEHLLDGPHVTYAIVELAGAPIGFQQWYSLETPDELDTRAKYGLDRRTRAFGIDQFIGESRLHGQGIGTRQVRAVSDWLLGAEGADLVVTDPVVENHRAIRCYEKAGFVRVRILPKHDELEGELRDVWLMWRLSDPREEALGAATMRRTGRGR